MLYTLYWPRSVLSKDGARVRATVSVRAAPVDAELNGNPTHVGGLLPSSIYLTPQRGSSSLGSLPESNEPLRDPPEAPVGH